MFINYNHRCGVPPQHAPRVLSGWNCRAGILTYGFAPYFTFPEYNSSGIRNKARQLQLRGQFWILKNSPDSRFNFR